MEFSDVDVPHLSSHFRGPKVEVPELSKNFWFTTPLDP